MPADLVRLSHIVTKKGGTCPGCGHQIFQRLITECIEELGYQKKCISVPGVGCTGLANEIRENEGFYPVPHGRGGATATGIKRCNPDVLVYTFQGDGDSMVIGLSETLNAAYRNEKISVFISINNFFSMTGGQLAWTSLPDQKTASSPFGRDCAITGKPMHLPEMIAESFDVAYSARGALDTVAHINQTKKMIMNALQAQINGEGYSIVEALSMCPTSWACSPQQSKEIIKNKIIPEFPVGEFKKRKGQQ